jgi:hypothetical protein
MRRLDSDPREHVGLCGNFEPGSRARLCPVYVHQVGSPVLRATQGHAHRLIETAKAYFRDLGLAFLELDTGHSTRARRNSSGVRAFD